MQITDYNADGSKPFHLCFQSVVRYYTTITFDTSWSLMPSFLKVHVVVKLYGDGGETESIQLKRCHYLSSVLILPASIYIRP